MGDYVPVILGAGGERPDDADGVRNASVVAGALARLGYHSDIVPVDLDLTVFEGLAAKAPATVFNLVESIRGDGRLGPFACGMLDHFGLPYTGAGSAAYAQSTSKLLTKTLLRAAGLPTPDWWLGAAPGGETVIVKSVCEHASFGMDQGSVVDGSEAEEEIARREAAYGGRFFAERFIDGREFNVSMLESDATAQVLPIAEMRFDGLPEDARAIVDYDAKWNESSPAYRNTVRAFGLEADEPALADRLRELSLACWQAADLKGYARIDFRVDRAGEPYILEFNANPCLAPDAGFAAALEQAGIGFDQGIAAIVAAAQRTRRG